MPPECSVSHRWNYDYISKGFSHRVEINETTEDRISLSLISRLFDCIDRCKTSKGTYKGDRPIISSNTAILITDIALKIANFVMFQKIANVLSIVSFVMVASICECILDTNM